MNLDGWVPLSQRQSESARSEVVLVEGVPPALRARLRDWLRDYLKNGHHAARVALRLNIATSDPHTALLATEGEGMLDAVDAALHWHPDTTPSAQPVDYLASLIYQGPTAEHLVIAVTELLSDATSAWTVTPNGSALERRVDITVRRTQEHASKSARKAKRPEAAQDLADAWAKTYGRRPAPSEAYRLAIRAVEDVAIPVVLGRSRTATLGKVRDHLRDAPGKWTTSMSPDTEALLAMVNLLWTRQTDRHAGQATLERVDQAAAEQAVHLATTLVQWFAAGQVKRLP